MRGRWRQLRCRANWRTVLSCFPFFAPKKVACLYGAQASNPSHEPLGEVRYDRLYADLIAPKFRGFPLAGIAASGGAIAPNP